MTPHNRIANARAELAAAHDALRASEALLALGTLRDAMSRTYYAAFHAARAVILLQGVQAKTHGGVLHLFSERVIRAGQLDSKYGLLLTRLQAYRHASDYAYAFEMEAGAVAAELAAARELVDRAQALVDAAPGEPSRSS